jgi:hypothetical protein
MWIEIDDARRYKAIRLNSSSFRIDNLNIDDLFYFRDWFKSSLKKIDNVKSIKFKSILEEGTYFNCTPILDINEEYVVINYDHYTSIDIVKKS